MRIGSRIFAVGAIPIAIAAGIALAAILLLNEANRSRGSAIIAGTVFRTLLTAVTVRNEFIQAPAGDRVVHARHFFRIAGRAREDLVRLKLLGSGDKAVSGVTDTLDKFVDSMDQLVAVTVKNDKLIANMVGRATALISLTDQARGRQHESNADVVNSLQIGDKKLREARDIVDAAYNLRMATAAVEAAELELKAGDPGDQGVVAKRMLNFSLTRLQHKTVELLDRALSPPAHGTDDPSPIAADAPAHIAALRKELEAGGLDSWSASDRQLIKDLASWSEQLLKVNAAAYRSYHEEASQLLTYSVQAHDTELATQNIAIETLKFNSRASEALLRRDESATRAVLQDSQNLPDTIAALPISPLIQAEMIEALDRWREALRTTAEGLGQQNTLLRGMDAAASNMIDAARSIDTSFSQIAEANGRWVGMILIFGAATGLLLGGGAAYFVARSITQPLQHLQSRMVQLAKNPDAELSTDSSRSDELGDMARATNVFLAEIARRERAINKARERADNALQTLQHTQADLIQAEKMASLGQLVAGVAHEINTPIGIALTTSTVIDEETRQFRDVTKDGRIPRSALTRLVDRVSEGSNLLTANLTRAADLIQSFKHVATDQVSGEQRAFDIRSWLQQLLTSLGPMLRKAGHVATMESPEALEVDTYPGVLAQVVTNLIVNASLHAFERGQPGTIEVTVDENGSDMVRLTVSDNGRGITAENRGRIFDPFFTTRRSEGSTGLGLHIVFNLVTSTLQGRIYFETSPGAGTRFIIDLPRSIRAVPAKAMRDQEAAV